MNRDSLETDLALAANGNEEAGRRVERAERALGKAIATLMLVLDVRFASLHAELDDLGRGFADVVSQAIEEVMYPGFEFDIRYENLDSAAYVVGAAWLVLSDFVGP